MKTKTKFVLTLTIEGESLESIDDALVRAGGERLLARMENAPKLFGKDLPKNGDASKTKHHIKVEEKKVVEGLKIPEPEPVPEPVKERAQLSKEEPQVRALRAVYLKLGEDGARECLNAFNVKKASELKHDQIEDFMRFCNSKLEEKEVQ